MKKKNHSILIAFVGIVAIVTAFILGGFFARPVSANDSMSSADAPETSETEKAEATTEVNPLDGKMIYMYDTQIGFAMSKSKESEILQESLDSGYSSSKFIALNSTGVKTQFDNVTFISEGELELNDAKIYIVDKLTLSELARGDFEEADLHYVKSYSTKKGSFDLYDKE